MAATDPRRTLHEIDRLGSEVYDRQVLPTLQPSDDNKTVAIDIDTGEFEIDDDDYMAGMRLRERRPEAEIWMRRVGRLARIPIGRQG